MARQSQLRPFLFLMTNLWSNSPKSRNRSAPKRKRWQLVVMALIVLAGNGVLPLGSSAISSAAPIDDKRAQAKAIQAQIDDLDIKISALAEQLHSAEEARDAALAAAKEAETQIVAARQEVSRTRKIVRARWAAIYQQSISGQGINELNLSNTDQLLSSRQYAKNQASSDNEMLDQLAVAQQDLAVKKSDYTAAAKEAEAQSLTISNSKRELEATETQQAAVLAQVSADIDALIKEEQRRQAAAAAAAAGRGRSSGRSPETFPDLPPPGPAAANAIAWARAQIGKPYNNTNPTRFGPDAFDCSGLVYMAYGMAGVSIPKVSGPQYQALPHVSMDALLPGDLIFWGGGGGSHVALYVGGGQIVEAGGSHGVSERAIWGNPQLAARPTG
ncbi:MAG: hypothetical protein F2861_03725 [Actinobacteria bacterium]|nr:hypothetical protein [Actinomycetota bacterium]